MRWLSWRGSLVVVSLVVGLAALAGAASGQITYSDGAAHGEGDSAFLSGVLADTGDVIFCPHWSDNVGIYDFENDTYQSGAAHGTGTDAAWDGAVLLGDGTVFCTPSNAERMGLYDPETDTWSNGTVHGQGGNAFRGGVQVADGRVILSPQNADNIGIYDPGPDVYTDGPEVTWYSDNNAQARPCLLDDGRVAMPPLNSGRLIIFDPEDDSVEIHTIVNSGGGEFRFNDCEQAGERVVLSPRNHDWVGLFNLSSESFSNGPAHGEGDSAYEGIIEVSDGRLVLSPRSADRVGIFNPFDDEWETGPLHGQGANAFMDTVPVNESFVTLAPWQADNIGIVSLNNPPSVNITNPLEGDTFHTGDVVNVTVEIEEGDNPLDEDSVVLDTNGDGVTVMNVTDLGNGSYEAWDEWHVGADAGSRFLEVAASDNESNTGGDTISVNVDSLFVEITNPVEDDSFLESETVNVTVDIDEIEVPLSSGSDAVVLDTNGDGVFSMNVTDLGGGSYEAWADWVVGDPFEPDRTLEVSAFDEDGGPSFDVVNVSTSDTVPPQVNITGPVEGSTHTHGETVAVTVAIEEGDFPVDTEDNLPVLDTNGDGVFEMNITDLGGGSYEADAEWVVGDPAGERLLEVAVFDTQSNVGGDSQTVNVEGAEGPVVSISNPSEGRELAWGATVNVSANVSEQDFPVDTEDNVPVLDTDGDGVFFMNITEVGEGEYVTWAEWTVGAPAGERDVAVAAFDTEGNSGGDVVTTTLNVIDAPGETSEGWAGLSGMSTNPVSGDYRVWVRSVVGDNSRIHTFSPALGVEDDRPICVNEGNWEDHLGDFFPGRFEGDMGVAGLAEGWAVVACRTTQIDGTGVLTLHLLDESGRAMDPENPDVDIVAWVTETDRFRPAELSYLDVEARDVEAVAWGGPDVDAGEFSFDLVEWDEDNVLWSEDRDVTGSFGLVGMSHAPTGRNTLVSVQGTGSWFGVGPSEPTEPNSGMAGDAHAGTVWLLDPSSEEALMRFEGGAGGNWEETDRVEVTTIGGAPVAHALDANAAGEVVAFIGGDEVEVRDADSLEKVVSIEADTTGLRGVEVAPDLRFVYGFSADTIYRWDVEEPLADAGVLHDPEDAMGEPDRDPATTPPDAFDPQNEGLFGDAIIQMIADGWGLSVVGARLLLAGLLVALFAIQGGKIAGGMGAGAGAAGALIVSLGAGLLPLWVFVAFVLAAAAFIAARW